MSFRDNVPYDKRLTLSQKILREHPTSIPVILIPYKQEIELSKTKFIIPQSQTVGQFLIHIHKDILINSKEAIFLFCNENTLVPTSYTFEALYSKFKSNDGFLYLTVTKENTFG